MGNSWVSCEAARTFVWCSHCKGLMVQSSIKEPIHPWSYALFCHNDLSNNWAEFRYTKSSQICPDSVKKLCLKIQLCHGWGLALIPNSVGYKNWSSSWGTISIPHKNLAITENGLRASNVVTLHSIFGTVMLVNWTTGSQMIDIQCAYEQPKYDTYMKCRCHLP